MKEYTKPYLVEFPKIGDSTVGFISIAESTGNIPFEIKRVFWTYFTPESVVRGRHAHHQTEQILLAIAGRIIVTTETRDGEIQTFILDRPNVGVYIPPEAWHTMQYSHVAVQMVLTSTHYDENDYIRNYETFRASES
jgi:dTDP-4-dehydrorhamnose 3,5-epimerase-like enzyme